MGKYAQRLCLSRHRGLHPSEVTLSNIKSILNPIWKTKTETATRVRQRIEAVLDWAYVHGLRSSDNPARWRGILDKIYPAPNQIKQVRHHPACHYSEAPNVVAQLRPDLLRVASQPDISSLITKMPYGLASQISASFSVVESFVSQADSVFSNRSTWCLVAS